MPYSRNNEDRVLDEIDALVDASLSAGDQSDTFHGTRYRNEHPCPWCREGFHFLPITQTMVEMRAGSYARDEFNQGIVDPDYRYAHDTSGVVCPGSEWKGPPVGDREWAWYKAKFPQPRSARFEFDTGRASFSGLSAAGRRKLRFVGPFEPWTISVEDNRVIDHLVSDPASVGLPGPRQEFDVVREYNTVAIFHLDVPFVGPVTQQWYDANSHHINHVIMTGLEHTQYWMDDVTIPFSSLEIFSENPEPNQLFPDYIEFTTDFPIERYPWLLPFFRPEDGTFSYVNPPLQGSQLVSTANIPIMEHHDCCDECTPGVYHHLDHGECNSGAAAMAQDYESDVVIIDETHHMTNERLRQHVEDARTGTTPSQAPGANQR